MKLLHTSDWHLGRTLCNQNRYEEFAAFLDWLVATIQQQQIDVLLIAGDVFDTNTPSHRAQALYYHFLRSVADSACQHVVVIAGNHDSPSFLEAPKALLKALNVHVIGSATEARADEVLLLHQADGTPALLVCAVPYLRDREIRTVEAGESVEDKARKLIAGIHQHYAEVAALAVQQRAALGLALPIVAMGHLFAAGGRTVEDDGVRELYVGSLAQVAASAFPDSFDYVALGHLHVPQVVNDTARIRYSGAPLAMGFGEATQAKSLCLVEFTGTQPTVQLLPVPVFQKILRIQGDWTKLSARIAELSTTAVPIWLEVIYDGAAILGDLRERLDAAIAGSRLTVLRIKNNRLIDQVLSRMEPDESLDKLTVDEVFERCLSANAVPAAQSADLRHAYQEICLALHEDDPQAA